MMRLLDLLILCFNEIRNVVNLKIIILFRAYSVEKISRLKLFL